MLRLYMCLHIFVSHIVSMQALMSQRELEKVANFSMFLESTGQEARSIRSFARQRGCTDQLLLVPFTKRQFMERQELSLLLSDFFVKS